MKITSSRMNFQKPIRSIQFIFLPKKITTLLQWMVISTGILDEIKELWKKQAIASQRSCMSKRYQGRVSVRRCGWNNATANNNNFFECNCKHKLFQLALHILQRWRKKIRDCKIWSPYNQFVGRSLMFTNLRDRS